MTVLYHTTPSTETPDQNRTMSKYWDRNGCPLNPTFTSVLLGTYGGGTLRNKNAKKVMNLPAYARRVNQ